MGGFNPAYMWQALPTIAQYIPTTLLIAVLAMLVSILVGLVLAMIRFAKIPVLDQIAVVYISFFRGIPGLVLLFMLYFGLPTIIPAMTGIQAMTVAVVGLGLKEAAYLAEIFRAGLNSVDRGQYEAGQSLGLSTWQIYSRYILPQAAYNALPGTANVFIGLIKETSIVFTLGITDIFAAAQIIAGGNLRYFETYLTVGLIYWLIVFIFERLFALLERALGRPYQR